MTTRIAQSHEALATANDRRLAQARLRADVREGRVSLLNLLADSPEDVLDVPLFDLARWTRSRRPGRTAFAEHIGRGALAEGVNLGLSVGRASERSRLWVAGAADWYRRGAERCSERRQT